MINYINQKLLDARRMRKLRRMLWPNKNILVCKLNEKPFALRKLSPGQISKSGNHGWLTKSAIKEIKRSSRPARIALLYSTVYYIPFTALIAEWKLFRQHVHNALVIQPTNQMLIKENILYFCCTFRQTYHSPSVHRRAPYYDRK